MKNVLRFVIITFLILSLTSALASDIDLSVLSFDELVQLKAEINTEITRRDVWQEVIVPAGVWEIGKDIPAGYWTIRVADGVYITSVSYCDILNEFGTGVGYGWQGWNGTLSGESNGERKQIDIDMVEGMYFINNCAVIFTPFTGKPDLGFK